jgi:hypothetical protein
MEPEWSPDGRELYFIGPTQEFTAAQVSTKPTFFVKGLQPLFSIAPFTDPGYHQSYAVAPDGKNFYFQMPGRFTATTRGVHLVWVDHWFSDLARQLKK